MTLQQFEKMFNLKNSEVIYEIITRFSKDYNLNTVNRMAGFLAQCGHESAGFTRFRENLNYSSDALHRVFKKYFPTLESAKPYHRKPEKIANKVYGNRMGNSDELSGDGWKFSGKGAIQITGKNNYSAFAKHKNMTLDEVSEYMLSLEGAIESALWFWDVNGLNQICDKDDVKLMTKRINGGYNGLEDRTKHYEEFKQILA